MKESLFDSTVVIANFLFVRLFTISLSQDTMLSKSNWLSFFFCFSSFSSRLSKLQQWKSFFKKTSYLETQLAPLISYTRYYKNILYFLLCRCILCYTFYLYFMFQPFYFVMKSMPSGSLMNNYGHNPVDVMGAYRMQSGGLGGPGSKQKLETDIVSISKPRCEIYVCLLCVVTFLQWTILDKSYCILQQVSASFRSRRI